MSIISLYEKSDKLFFVGGIVRDELLGKTSPDIDLTFVGDAVEFFKSSEFEILQISEDFGSVHLKIDDKTVDITSTRTETYPNKGQLPIVEKIGCSLEQDVKRRDFTVNAIAKNCKTGEIVDYVGGIEDLKNKKLRILHDKSFIDDPTRIIRGLKFAVRFGFDLEEQTKKLQDEYLKNIDYNMSFKRLKDELVDSFNLNKQVALDKFIEQKMYKLLSQNEYVPYVCKVEDVLTPYLDEVEIPWIVYLSGFDLSNLSLTKREIKILDDAKKLLATKFEDDYEKFKAFKNVEIESVLIYAIQKDRIYAEEYLNKYRHVKLNIGGKDLLAVGFEPSKKISEVLEIVEKEKLRNPNMTKDEEIKLACNYL